MAVIAEPGVFDAWDAVDTAGLRGGWGLRDMQQAALLQLGEQVVDRGEPDIGPLPDAALLDHLLQVVTVLRPFDDQAQHGQLCGSQLHGQHASPRIATYYRW